MNKLLLSLLIALATVPAWAQSTAATGRTDVEAERSRLTAERAEVDKAFNDQRGVCFKRFAVEECLAESRRKKRTALDNIKRQEALLNDAERKRRAGAALNRLDEKTSAERAADATAQREKAAKDQQERDQRAAAHSTSRADTKAQEAEKVRQYQSKQRAHADHLAQQASRRAEAPAEASRQAEKVRKAEAHRAEVEKKNAERTKPRSAPLPPPPP